MNVVERPGDIRIECDYHADLSDAATVRGRLAYFEAIPRAVTADPQVKLPALADDLAESDRRRRAPREKEFRESRRRKSKGIRPRPVS